MRRLENRVAVISGAAAGLAWAITSVAERAAIEAARQAILNATAVGRMNSRMGMSPRGLKVRFDFRQDVSEQDFRTILRTNFEMNRP